MSDFQVFIDWLNANGFDTIASILSIIFGLVIMIIQIKKYKFNSNQAKEDELKYRQANYREQAESPAQTFDTEVEQYRLNKSTNELEVLPDKLDIQQVVQSAEAQSLSNMLQHLEPPFTDLEQTVDVHNDLLDKLDYMREADEFRLSLCEKYNLNPRLSLDKVIDYLKEQETLTRGQITEMTRQKEVKNETSQVSSVEPSQVVKEV